MCFVVPVLVVLVLFDGVVQAGRPVEVHTHLVEVFATNESPVTDEAPVNIQGVLGEMEYHVYELDGIQRVEAKLSQDLTADPTNAKRVVLQRFQQLQTEDRERMQRAAMGLAKAIQYGVDRYPAIVFDGQAVVYGVIDVQTALMDYRTWRQEGKQ